MPTRCSPGPVSGDAALVGRFEICPVAPRLALLLEFLLLQLAVGQIPRLQPGADAGPIDDVLLVAGRRP